MNTQGWHLICELSGCSPEILADKFQIENALRVAAEKANATILHGFFHEFSPQGISGLLCLSESHISIHTWPEAEYASLDIYTCGEHTNPELAVESLTEALLAKSVSTVVLNRGIANADGTFVARTLADEAVVEKQNLSTEGESAWYTERTDPDERHGFKVDQLLFEGESAYQGICIIQNSSYGKVLFLDGASQSAQSDEYIYHEALIQPAMFLHPTPERVLILGGGEGASLREVLKHNAVKRAVMVDIDKMVVEQSRKYLPEWSKGAYEDPRSELIIADGYEWVKGSTERFDVIIMDLTDQIDLGPSFPLYTKSFFSLLRQRLQPGGIVVIQSGMLSAQEMFSHGCIRKTLKTALPFIRSYLQMVPSFMSEWSFIIGSERNLPIEELAMTIESQIAKRLTSGLEFYGRGAHRRMFSLSKDLEQRIDQAGIVITTRDEFEKNVIKKSSAEVKWAVGSDNFC